MRFSHRLANCIRTSMRSRGVIHRITFRAVHPLNGGGLHWPRTNRFSASARYQCHPGRELSASMDDINLSHVLSESIDARQPFLVIGTDTDVINRRRQLLHASGEHTENQSRVSSRDDALRTYCIFSTLVICSIIVLCLSFFLF